MAFDITQAISRIQDDWLSITGIRAAPDEPIEKLDPFPIAITFERFGEMNNEMMYSGSFAPTTGTIWSELHIQRVHLPLSVREAMSYRTAFLRKIQDDENLNSFMMLVRRVRWTFMPMEWNAIPTVGYRFEFDYITEIQPS